MARIPNPTEHVVALKFTWSIVMPPFSHRIGMGIYRVAAAEAGISVNTAEARHPIIDPINLAIS